MARTVATMAGLVLLLTAGCGSGQGSAGAPSVVPSSSGAPVNTCTVAHRSSHVAYLVVQHISGRAIERCAGFDGDTIMGDAVMRATGIQFRAGSTEMCQIDEEPLAFVDCTRDQPHWSAWLYREGSWSEATVPYASLQLHDREALGWRYVVSPGSLASPPPAPQPL